MRASFYLHADTWLHENDVVGLERLCDHGARGPLSLGRAPWSVPKWRALVQGTWSLVDLVGGDGQRYVVARKNGPALQGLMTVERGRHRFWAWPLSSTATSTLLTSWGSPTPP